MEETPYFLELKDQITKAEDNYNKVRFTFRLNQTWERGMDTSNLSNALKRDAARLEREWDDLFDAQAKL